MTTAMLPKTSTVDETAASSTRARNQPVWLFSPAVDLSVFLGSAAVSLGLLAIGAWYGLLHDDTPEWAWVPFVLLVDVAHVYATGFRVYFDPVELRRRPLLYYGAPLAAFAIGWAIHSESPPLFWTLLAYLAVFHFVRQQYGWVAMYRAKAREPLGWEKWIDGFTIYIATIHPLIYWHAHLPREFWWFRDWDFQAVPTYISQVSAVVYWAAILAYCLKAVWLWRIGRANLGKDIVVVTTILCWRLGIITFNSDYAFTVTNVIIHGVPYFALIYWYMRAQGRRRESSVAAPAASLLHDQLPAGRMDDEPSRGGWWSGANWRTTLIMMLATVWVLAFVEEMVWDRFIWQERSWLFGGPVADGSPWLTWLAPLLATPQATHYILDGFIWRRRSNPQLQSL